ncbi:SGNH/GDSL hydrolase family protein [Enterobacter asburiae]|jgi:lysophospholipase L1-like esterase|uniref:SGNH/GDSL hydrolase family protein n=1 Tax=Enterobacter asburiae TaxID=61645 RepID=UPI001A9363B6|nr:SGNH/GDSL hydrolase family protein [Enterobacter asburiae]EKS7202314.1 SGNH/GDSL hydrolase family protein [Enterobacter asburiae]HCR1902390.1 SGNH/GDSL hydrolase family protein [Enterobacter asburiae]HCR2011772.1 SGNH/GDSL hydrolase family protein [Enterobacter asburiae]HCR2223266.1 SGNH/GDSL hydrolase family protein [Enterobacter asburiae]HDX3904491.1 SGNH/GDSL hydrolase family protein [Enterobacter asburiae]
MSISRRKLLSMAAPAALAAGAAPQAFGGKSKKTVSAPASLMRASRAANLLADGKKVAIACFGDSTMWGSMPGATTTKNYSNPPNSLQLALDLIYPGLTTVSNNAIPGTTIKKLLNGTDGGVGSYEDRLSKSDALVIYCNHCLNDCNSYQSDEHEYKSNIMEFVNITRRYGKIPVIVTPSVISPIRDGKEFMMKRMPAFIQPHHAVPAFIQAQRDVAAEMNVDLVDNFYYSLKTSRMIPANKINGDGVHLTDSAYQNAGWNMAIPLVLPNKLINNYDLCGLSTTQYYDKIKHSRAIWDVENRFGSVLTGDSLPEKQIINFPLLLDSPTDHSTLSICGFTSEAGGISNITYFGKSDDLRYSGKINYKISSGLKHDQVFNSEKCFLSAGFHIIGIESSNEIGSGNFNFAGVQLCPKPSNA